FENVRDRGRQAEVGEGGHGVCLLARASGHRWLDEISLEAMNPRSAERGGPAGETKAGIIGGMPGEATPPTRCGCRHATTAASSPRRSVAPLRYTARMSHARRRVGSGGEAIAAAYLAGRGVE